MAFGVHVPQIRFGDTDWDMDRLAAYVERAEELGFQYRCANDHFLVSQPWLHGPTVLAAGARRRG